MGPPPESRYADARDGVQLAYCVAGSGPTTVIASDGATPVELSWEGPVAAFSRRMSSFSRFAWFDPSGRGTSGGTPGDARVVERVAEDKLSVLDALGVDRAVLLGFAMAPALVFAATWPNRTQALVLIDPTARFRSDDAYPGLDQAQVDALLDSIERGWGTGVMARRHTVRGDTVAPQFWGRSERMMNTPRDARLLFAAVFDTDLRALLSTISAPTLIIARRNQVGLPQSRYVADHIPTAQYIEVEDDNPYGDSVLDAIEEFVTGGLPDRRDDRVLATVLFTDIADSTATAVSAGDRTWRRQLDAHDAMVRRELDRFRGREVKTTGDGFLATFDGPARAIRCGCAIRDGARAIGLDVRVGLHTGEVELRGEDIAGVTVHIGARVAAHAQPGEVLVSRTVVDLVAGSDLTLRDRGAHDLKGVPGPWHLFAVDG